jgi:hypothetical protein
MLGCELKHKVSDNRTDGSRGGTGCLWTGGRCLPCEKCDERRQLHSQEQTDWGDEQ